MITSNTYDPNAKLDIETYDPDKHGTELETSLFHEYECGEKGFYTLQAAVDYADWAFMYHGRQDYVQDRIGRVLHHSRWRY